MPIDLYLKSRTVEYYILHNIENQMTNDYLSKDNLSIDCVQRPIDVRQLRHKTERNKIAFDICIRLTQTVGASYCVTLNSNIICYKKFKLANVCSAFQASLLAILNTIEYIYNKGSCAECVIHVNSKAIKSALENSSSTSPLINNIYENYYRCHENDIHISFCSYTSDDNKEIWSQVKKWSREAADSHNRICYDLSPKTYIRRQIFNKNIEEWETRWQNTTKGSITKQYIPTVSKRQQMKHFMPNLYITQAISGHGNVNAYLERFKVINSNNCDYCGNVVDSIEHRIYFCAHFETQRNHFRQIVERNGQSWPIKYEDMVEEKNFESFKEYVVEIFK